MSSTVPSPPDTSPVGWRLDGLMMAVLAVAAVLAFSPALFNGWVYDDGPNIVANQHVRSWASVPRAFVSMEVNAADSYFHYATWRPLRHLSFVIDYHIAGLSPVWFHAVNLVLHALATVLGYLLMRTTGASATACLIGALVFAVHPVQSEAVVLAKERDGLLAAAFLLGALCIARRPSATVAVVSTLLFACSLLAKESTIVGPALLIALVALWSRLHAERWPRWLPMLGAWTAIALAYLVIRHLIIGKTAQATPIGGTMAATMWTMGEVFARYLGLILWPMELPVSFTHITPRSLLHPAPWLGFGMMAGLMFTVWRAVGSARLVALGIAWYLIALFPVSNAIPMQQWMQVRFLYLPMVGVAMAVAGLWQLADARGWTRRLALGDRVPALALGVAPLVMLMMMLSALRATEWKSNDTLWTAEYLMNPSNREARVGAARSMLRNGQADEVLRMMDEPVDPATVVPISTKEIEYQIRSLALYRLKRIDESLATMEDAARRWPTSPTTLQFQGQLLADAGRSAQAIAVWEKLAAARPNHAPVWLALERAYTAAGRTDDAAAARARRLPSSVNPPGQTMPTTDEAPDDPH